MKQHEREYFVYSIRSGKVFLPNNIVIISPTIDQLVEACQIYNDAYSQAIDDEIMTEEEMLKWMQEQYIWTTFHENKLKETKDKLENLKVNIYESRLVPKDVKKIRISIRETEQLIMHQIAQKNANFPNTCEGFANTAKTAWLIQNTALKHDKLYDFSDMSIESVIDHWYASFLTDSQCREIARNEPWKSLWIIHEKSKIRLFANSETNELTHNQKNLIIWSQMYDNIQESMECPSSDVIEDDDMLDGWFIVQNRKRDKEKLEKEFENNTKNAKIKNSSEVFMVAKSKEQVEQINKLNTEKSKQIIKQRSKLIDEKGEVEQGDFIDEKLKAHEQKIEQASRHFKSK